MKLAGYPRARIATVLCIVGVGFFCYLHEHFCAYSASHINSVLDSNSEICTVFLVSNPKVLETYAISSK